MKCIYCNHSIVYKLNTKQLKCAKCKRKFSPKKIARKKAIIECFCDNLTANQTHKKLHIHYKTILKEYQNIRKYIAYFLEQNYNQNSVTSYDEYIYLEKSKKIESKNIFDAKNFLTFEYDGKIYNLLLFDLSRYKQEFLNDGIDETYFKEFSRYMMLNKIAKIQHKENLIQRFWAFFEENIVKYKGINKDNFFYYLKELEFKFNYSKDEQKVILNKFLY